MQNPPLRVSENANPDGAIEFDIADLFITNDPVNVEDRIHFADPDRQGEVTLTTHGPGDGITFVDPTEIDPGEDGPRNDVGEPDPETIQARAINMRYHGVDPAVALDDRVDETMARWEEDRLAHPTPEMPIQPLYWDEDGTLRFRENRIVRKLLDGPNIDLNDIGSMYIRGEFNQAEMEQFTQLIGYSISGWTELNYVSDHTWDRALNTSGIERNPRHTEAA